MTNLRIIRLGHPALRKQSAKVTLKELRSDDFQTFLDDLVKICDEQAGVGIAAPQVSINKQVIVVHVDPKNPRYLNKKPFPGTVIINPVIKTKSNKETEDWEGDLSCNLRALVPRAISCVVQGIDRNGIRVTYNLDDPFHARVFQHEIDHLHGIFLLDKVVNVNSISEITEWNKYWKNKNIG